MANFYDHALFREFANTAIPTSGREMFLPACRSQEDLQNMANELSLELRIRLAKRIVVIHRLPYIVGINPHIQKIHDMYVDTFNKLHRFPTITDAASEEEFSHIILPALNETAPAMRLMALAMKEIGPYFKKADMTEFIDHFLVSRITRRLLAEHYLAERRRFLSGGRVKGQDPEEDFACDAEAVLHKVYQQGKEICLHTYGVAPKLKVLFNDTTRFHYITGHLEYMLLELVKNSLRATTERFLEKNLELDPLTMSETIPDVEVSIYRGEHGITIKIHDDGGGIPAHLTQSVMYYSVTTVNKEDHATDAAAKRNTFSCLNGVTMAGEGFGLPMVRVYARYFRGDLSLQTISQRSTEAFLTLRDFTGKASDICDMNIN